MRTTEQILARIREVEPGDLLGFEREVLISYLPFDAAKPFLKPEATDADWPAVPPTHERLLDDMREYMAFAWEKALDQRGISATRSVQKMTSRLWLLEDDELARFAADDANYFDYGIPILTRICDAYNLPTPTAERAS